jgi:hypothetical protein
LNLLAPAPPYHNVIDASNMGIRRDIATSPMPALNAADSIIPAIALNHEIPQQNVYSAEDPFRPTIKDDNITTAS